MDEETKERYVITANRLGLTVILGRNAFPELLSEVLQRAHTSIDILEVSDEVKEELRSTMEVRTLKQYIDWTKNRLKDETVQEQG